MSVALFAVASLFMQDPQVAAPPAAPVYRVEDVVVEGRRLEEAADLYVDEVVAPARGRGPARWDDGVCVGVANFNREVAQYLADRVTDLARELGLRGHTPPCNPSILIIGAADGADFARELIEQRPRLFIVGGAGMDRGRGGLDDFRSGDRAVRWWHVSIPVDEETGDIAVRLPGDYSLTYSAQNPLRSMEENFAPQTRRTFASRLREPLRDVMKRSFVIIDVDMLNGVTLEQLGDYVAFVSLAQIDPEADLSRFDSVLNLFRDERPAEGLSAWDKAYLEGLYSLQPGYVGEGAQTSALGRSILAAYRAGEIEAPAPTDAP